MLSGRPIFLRRALELGERLLGAFEDSPAGLPRPAIDLRTRRGWLPGWMGGAVALSEVGTLQLEFVFLSHLSGDLRFARAAHRVEQTLARLPHPAGLWSAHIDWRTGSWAANSRVTLGALGDSVRSLSQSLSQVNVSHA